MHRFRTLIMIIATVVSTSEAAFAQSAPTQAQSPPAPAAGRSDCPPSATHAPTLGKDNSAKPLSDQLADSKGIICPPGGVDPQMASPPPAGGNTPVIPPPGSPGGDPSIQPK